MGKPQSQPHEPIVRHPGAEVDDQPDTCDREMPQDQTEEEQHAAGDEVAESARHERGA